MWDVSSQTWGSNPLHWKQGVLTTGPPGKSPKLFFYAPHVCSHPSRPSSPGVHTSSPVWPREDKAEKCPVQGLEVGSTLALGQGILGSWCVECDASARKHMGSVGTGEQVTLVCGLFAPHEGEQLKEDQIDSSWMSINVPLSKFTLHMILFKHGYWEVGIHALNRHLMCLFCSLNQEYKVKVKVTQWCPTLCDPMDYTVHGIL